MSKRCWDIAESADTILFEKWFSDNELLRILCDGLNTFCTIPSPKSSSWVGRWWDVNEGELSEKAWVNGNWIGFSILAPLELLGFSSWETCLSEICWDIAESTDTILFEKWLSDTELLRILCDGLNTFCTISWDKLESPDCRDTLTGWLLLKLLCIVATDSLFADREWNEGIISASIIFADETMLSLETILLFDFLYCELILSILSFSVLYNPDDAIFDKLWECGEFLVEFSTSTEAIKFSWSTVESFVSTFWWETERNVGRTSASILSSESTMRTGEEIEFETILSNSPLLFENFWPSLVSEGTAFCSMNSLDNRSSVNCWICSDSECPRTDCMEFLRALFELL